MFCRTQQIDEIRKSCMIELQTGQICTSLLIFFKELYNQAK